MSEEEPITDKEVSANRFPSVQRYPPNLSFLNAIPTQAQKGFKNINIIFKCLDVCEQYIAVGTNIGVAYLYDRKKDKLHKLRSGDYTDAVTCVKLLVSLECLVAVGTITGAVFAFKVPFKEESEIEKFKVEGFHSNKITALEWVKNGIKFFSGDANGVVVSTEIDHLEHQSLSEIILEETKEIVQLSYSSQKLLVSTVKRCLIYDFKERSFFQVGQKDRNSGSFGGTFYQDTSDECIYSCRPGQRIWKSGCNGIISETIILKGAFTALSQLSSRNGFKELQFGLLKVYCDEFLLTWSSNKVVLIDPLLRTVKSLGHFPDIVEISTCHDEIFIVQGLRNVIRLAVYSEDKEDFLIKDEPDLLPLEKFDFVENEEKKTVKSDSTDSPNVFDWIKRKFSEVSVFDDNENEESTKASASNLPDVVKLDEDHPQVQISSESPEQVFGQVTRKFSASNDEIVYKPKKKKKKKKKVQFPSDVEVENNNAVHEDHVDSQGGMEESKKGKTKDGQTINLNDFSAETIDAKNDSSTDTIDAKNDLSADIDDNHSLKSSDLNDVVESNNTTPIDSVSISSIPCSIKDDSSSDNIEVSLLGETNIDSSVSDDVVDGLQIERGSVNSFTASVVDEIDSTVKYDSLFDFDGNVLANSIIGTEEHEAPSENCADVTKENVLDLPKYGIECIQYKSPGSLISMCASNIHMFCVDNQNCLYISEFYKSNFHWLKLDQLAEQVAVSPSENIVWALYKGTAFVAKRCNVNESLKGVEWVPVARSVSYIAVSDTCSWYITWEGKLFTCQNLSIAQPYSYPTRVRCPSLVQVACKDDIVWAITTEGKLCREICSKDAAFENTKWKEISLPSRLPVSSMSFSSDGVAYVVDQGDNLWVCLGVNSTSRKGFKSIWQVESGTYVYETPYNPAFKSVVGKVINTELFSSLIHGQAHKLLTSSEKGVWWCKSSDSVFHSCQRYVIGHNWEPVVPKGTVSSTKWEIVSAVEYSKCRDIFWAYSSSRELMCSSLKKSNCIVVDLPDSVFVQCMYSTVDSLWVLSTKGDIFIRRDISERSPQGVWWQQLNTSQLSDIHLIHMSCSSDIVWACDGKGSVFARIGTLHPSTGSALMQAWIEVDAQLDENAHLIQKSKTKKRQKFPEKIHVAKVYVGPKSYMVWIIDDKGLVYVRSNITPKLMVGSEWVKVPGPRAKQLCISSTGVWLVKYSGKLFRRFGITENNVTGDYWKQIPGRVSFLSVTKDDDLWGIYEETNLCRHFSHTIEYKIPGGIIEEEPQDVSDEDWEDVSSNLLDDQT